MQPLLQMTHVKALPHSSALLHGTPLTEARGAIGNKDMLQVHIPHDRSNVQGAAHLALAALLA